MSKQLAVSTIRQDVSSEDVNHLLDLATSKVATPRISQELYMFLTEVLHGLSKPSKTLPCKYFYDAIGSKLFEDICELSEYYVTRTEKLILHDVVKDLAKTFNKKTNVIEPGSGAGEKVRILLNSIPSVNTFTPVEISASALAESAEELASSYPNLSILPLQGDFTNEATLRRARQELDALQSADQQNLVFFPGSTIGNFSRTEAVQVLKNLSVLAGPDGSLLVGYDLIKNEFRLTQAYDDSLGVTAAFNKNLLARINKELYGNFDVENGFAHSAIFNRMYNRIEMHLVSTKDQKVSVAGHSFWFRKGETIHTESSHKYSKNSFAEIAQRAGLAVSCTWTDADNQFAVSLLHPR